MKNYFLKLNFRSPYSALRTPESGFTIIETLVALSIFTTSILAIIVMTPGSVSAINLAKNKMTASYLAQEGIDLVRAIRDNGNIASPSYDGLDLLSQEGMCGAESVDNGCFINFLNLDLNSPNSVQGCPDDGCPLLAKAENPQYIGFNYPPYNSHYGVTMPFRRTIFVSPASPGSDFVVTSIVEWSQGGQPNTAKYQTNLTKWNLSNTP